MAKRNAGHVQQLDWAVRSLSDLCFISFHSIWKINQAEETVDSVVENFQTMNLQF